MMKFLIEFLIFQSVTEDRDKNLQSTKFVHILFVLVFIQRKKF